MDWPWWADLLRPSDVQPMVIPVKLIETLCVQNICGWNGNPSCKDSRKSLKYGERNVDPYYWLDMIRAAGGFHVEVDYNTNHL